MKKIILILMLMMVVMPAAMAWWLFPEKPSPATRTAADPTLLKKKAYEYYERGQFEDSAENFRKYLSDHPSDAQAAFDYANLLAQLNRHEDAARILEGLHQLDPQREAAYFKLGVEYVALMRHEDAARIFSDLLKSSNPDMALSAAEAGSRLRADLDHAAKFEAERNVYELAKKLEWTNVVSAVDAIEKQGPVSFPMEMQRLYGMVNLQQYASALAKADALAPANPKATDLALLRGDLLIQLGRKNEAIALWEQVERDFPDTDAAATAHARLMSVKGADAAQVAAVETAGVVTAPAQPTSEEIIYDLAAKNRFSDVVKAIDRLEAKEGKLKWEFEMQRLYSLQALGNIPRASKVAETMAKEKPDNVELAMMRSDMYVTLHEWEEASCVLKQIKESHPDTPVEKEAIRRLRELPPISNLDKWQWGEAYFSGEYHDRFDAVIGSGLIRQGTYFTDARWLQPYLSMKFGVDTLSGAAGGVQQTVIADNSISLLAGIRAQPFKTEYLFLYFETGFNEDLLNRRYGGAWHWDYQAGIYGFKSWGPGNWFKDMTSGTNKNCSATWRGDWFVDAGADFSYYHRFLTWLGYGQGHQGLRLAQFGSRKEGSHAFFDVYVFENLAWDVRGNYFDNLIEIGPGARLIWIPGRNWQVILRTEYSEGFYFGRDDLNSRGIAKSQYDDFRVSLSVGVTW